MFDIMKGSFYRTKTFARNTRERILQEDLHIGSYKAEVCRLNVKTCQLLKDGASGKTYLDYD
jgi:hypothetical protein